MRRLTSLNKAGDLSLGGFNRAVCYFAGPGIERNLQTALDYASKPMSNKNQFAETFSAEKNAGLYEDLVR